jgi:hypothetical protein
MLGLRIYRSRGRRYAYYYGVAIKARYDTPAFWKELEELRAQRGLPPRVLTLSHVIKAYLASPVFAALDEDRGRREKTALTSLRHIAYLEILDESALEKKIAQRARNARGGTYARGITIAFRALMKWAHEAGVMTSPPPQQP